MIFTGADSEGCKGCSCTPQIAKGSIIFNFWLKHEIEKNGYIFAPENPESHSQFSELTYPLLLKYETRNHINGKNDHVAPTSCNFAWSAD